MLMPCSALLARTRSIFKPVHRAFRFHGIIPVLLLIIYTLRAGGQINAPLVQQIDALLQSPALKGGIQGCLVLSSDGGQPIYQHMDTLSLLPASNQKIFTSAAALTLLGADRRFITTLRTTGTIRNGTLIGNLILEGGGDPVLSLADITRFADDVKKLGIRRIHGRVIGVRSLQNDTPYPDGWSWDDLPYAYAAVPCGLNVEENRVIVQVRPGYRPGSRPKVKMNPEGGISIDNRAITAAPGKPNTLVIGRIWDGSSVSIRGSIATGMVDEQIAVSDPAQFAVRLLCIQLRKAGIYLKGGTTRQSDRIISREIARHESPTLSEIVRTMNKTSDNLIAEVLLMNLGALDGGKGTTKEGLKQITRWMSAQGIPTDFISLHDGSGLSRLDRATAWALAKTLILMRNNDDFVRSLPVAGVDGTLQKRMLGTAAAGNCKAKTGSMSGICSLSGYVTTADGQHLVFVMLMNNHSTPANKVREVQDKTVNTLAGWRQEAPSP